MRTVGAEAGQRDVMNIDAVYGKPDEGRSEALTERAMTTLAILLAIVSGYTTLKGMLKIFGSSEPVFSSSEAFFSTAAAFVITAVVQTALTVLCWVLGKDLARALTAKMHETKSSRQSASAKIGRYFMMLFLVLLCLLISAFFSFNTYYTGLYKGEEELRIAEASVPDFGIEVRSILNQSVAEFRSDRRDVILSKVRDSGFLDGIAKLSSAAEGSKELLESRVKELNQQRIAEEKDRIRQRIESGQEIDKSRKALSETEDRIDEISDEIKTLEDGIAGQRSQIDELRKQEKAFNDEAECERIGCDGRKQGTGEKFSNGIASARKADRDAKALENRTNVDQGKVEALVGERTEITIRIEQAKLELGEPAKSEAVVGEVQTPAEENALPPIETVDQNIAELTKAEKAFEDLPTEERFLRLGNLCADLKKAILEDATLAPNIEGVRCELTDQALAQEIAAFTGQNKLINVFSGKCAELDIDALTLSDAAPRLRECYQLALKSGVPRAQDALVLARDSISAFEQRFDPSQHEFLKTLRAFSVSPLLALLAAFIAGIQDVAVFIMTFIVEFFRRERIYVRNEELDRFLSGSQREALHMLLAGMQPVPNLADQYAFIFNDEKKAKMSIEEINAVNDVLFDLRSRRLLVTPSATEFRINQTGYEVLSSRLRSAKKQETIPSASAATTEYAVESIRVKPAWGESRERNAPEEPPVGLSSVQQAAWKAKQRRAASRQPSPQYSSPLPNSNRAQRSQRHQENTDSGNLDESSGAKNRMAASGYDERLAQQSTRNGSPRQADETRRRESDKDEEISQGEKNVRDMIKKMNST